MLLRKSFFQCVSYSLAPLFWFHVINFRLEWIATERLIEQSRLTTWAVCHDDWVSLLFALLESMFDKFILPIWQQQYVATVSLPMFFSLTQLFLPKDGNAITWCCWCCCCATNDRLVSLLLWYRSQAYNLASLSFVRYTTRLDDWEWSFLVTVSGPLLTPPWYIWSVLKTGFPRLINFGPMGSWS